MKSLEHKLLNLNGKSSKWLKYYVDLCLSRKKHGIIKSKLDFLTHRHHIIPECLGGLDIKSNLVLLTPREHRLAHILLTKIFPENPLLKGAVIFLTPKDSNGNKISSHLIDCYTRDFYEAVGKFNSKNLTGRTKEQDAGYKKISIALTGRTKETHDYLKQTSMKLKGRTKENHKGVRRHSEKMKGRTKENNEGMCKMAKSLQGRSKETHQYIRDSAEKLNKLTIEQRAELIELMKNGMSAKNVTLHFESEHNIKFSASLPIRHFRNYKQQNKLENSCT